ncbi:element excision factor XisI family protein [Microcoleus vaginatus]|uniref:element excision factor XisI family protein n=1 Tax=Microcoleus vaginatus TaxID=119532 RepID=UPI0002E1637C
MRWEKRSIDSRENSARDKLTEYPKLIKRILTEYIELCDRHSQQDIETFLITDEQNGHYSYFK